MSVTKDEVKSFVRAVRIKQDAIIAATYAPIALFSLLQKDIGDLSYQVDTVDNDNIDDGFTAAERAILAELANQSTFNAADVDDVFSSD